MLLFPAFEPEAQRAQAAEAAYEGEQRRHRQHAQHDEVNPGHRAGPWAGPLIRRNAFAGLHPHGGERRTGSGRTIIATLALLAVTKESRALSAAMGLTPSQDHVVAEEFCAIGGSGAKLWRISIGSAGEWCGFGAGFLGERCDSGRVGDGGEHASK